MSGIFNIAVAEFGETSPDGAVHASVAGKQMSAWTANYLRKTLTQEDLNLLVWPEEDNIFGRTHMPLVEPSTAEKTAGEIKADLLIYGIIDTRTDPAQLTL